MTAVGGDGGYHFDCSVCADALDADDQSVVTLECGHTFHATCIVRWFRIGGSTCPNCRADRGDAVWRIHTRGTRLSQMRRRAHNRLTPDVRSKLKRLDHYRRRLREVLSQRRAFRSEHRDVFARSGTLDRLRRDYAAKAAVLARTLDEMPVRGMPLLQAANVEEEEGSGESDFEYDGE